MISGKKLYDFIKDESVSLPKEELKRIIDEELEKNESEMDSELIEYCLDALEEAERTNNKTSEKGESDGKRRIINFRKALTVAVAAVAVIVGTITASAVFSESFRDDIVEIYDDYIGFHFEKSDEKADKYEMLNSDLAKELEENGFSPLLLPEAALSEDFEVKNVTYEDLPGLSIANIDFKYKRKKGSIIINKREAMNEEGERAESLQYPTNSGRIEKIDSNGISIYIIEQSRNSVIVYQDGVMRYDIFFSASFEKTLDFAKTIK